MCTGHGNSAHAETDVSCVFSRHGGIADTQCTALRRCRCSAGAHESVGEIGDAIIGRDVGAPRHGVRSACQGDVTNDGGHAATDRSNNEATPVRSRACGAICGRTQLHFAIGPDRLHLRRLNGCGKFVRGTGQLRASCQITKTRQRNPGDDRDHRNDNHQLDQGESPLTAGTSRQLDHIPPLCSPDSHNTAAAGSIGLWGISGAHGRLNGLDGIMGHDPQPPKPA